MNKRVYLIRFMFVHIHRLFVIVETAKEGESVKKT